MPELVNQPSATPAQETPAATTTTTKTTAKPAAKKPAKAAASNGEKKKSPVGKPQGRILKFLAKNPLKAYTRKEISEKAEVDNAYCTSYLGSADKDIREKNDKATKSLYTMGLVKFGPKQEEGGAVTYQITAKGKEVAAKV